MEASLCQVELNAAFLELIARSYSWGLLLASWERAERN